MYIENIISLTISILALLISWCAFRLSKRTFERDRSDLRLRVKYEHKTGLGHSFWVILVNHGRRLVTIEEVQLCMKSGKVRSYAELSGKNINLPVKLPVELQETARCHFQFPLYGENGLIHTPLDIKQAEAYDTFGERYSFPTRKIKSQIDFIKLKWQITREWKKRGKDLQ